MPSVVFIRRHAPRSPSAVAVDPKQPAVERFRDLELRVDACGEGGEIRIHGADDDAGVVGMLPVKANEVLTVVGDDGTLVRSCETQHLVIRDGRVGIAGIERGGHVMAANAEGGDDREWEILV